MNKDMINIDDFVREKLGGQPEREDPAAWLRMKALLDKEMPERAVPFYFRWGKPMAFLGAAILLSGLCVGGFEITKAIRAKNDGTTLVNKVKNTEISHSPSGSSTTPSGLTANNQLSQNNQSDISAIDQQKAELNKLNKEVIFTTNNGVDEVKHTEKVNDQNSNSNIATSTHSRSVNNSKSSDKTTSVAEVGQNKNKSTDRNNASIVGNSTSNTSDKPIAPNSDLSNKVESKNKDLKSKNAESLVSNHNNKQRNNTKAIDNKNVAANKTLNTNSKLDVKKSVAKQVKPSKASNHWSSGVKSSTAAIDKVNTKDSIPYTTIIQKESLSKKFPRSITTLIDTQGKGKIALPAITESNLLDESKESVLVTNQELKSGDQSKKANEYSSSSNQSNAVALKKDSADSKNAPALAKDVKKSKRKSLWEMLNLPEATANAKKDISNAQFYAGFSGGLNYSLSKTNNFQGVQFGPTGELVFNKHWSLFGAIRYFNRSGGTKTVNDHYAKESANNTPDSTSGANWYFKVHTDSTNRYFNFSTLHSFEMPITLRYALNKFYFLTGLNLAYYLSVNVEEVQKTYGPINSHMVQTNSAKPILKESKPLLNTSDFGSKFGLGFVVGAGYQIAPAWQADIKLVNTFWDNAKGDGANKLSKDFYKLPSVQISVGYQFNRAKVKPTYGPTSIAP